MNPIPYHVHFIAPICEALGISDKHITSFVFSFPSVDEIPTVSVTYLAFNDTPAVEIDVEETRKTFRLELKEDE